VINFDGILQSIKPHVRDLPQETRMRQLYERTYAGYQTEGTQGI
jgi:hypothetical protein